MDTPMNKSGKVYLRDTFAGIITENEDGFSFQYDANYLKLPAAVPISLTLPLSETPYKSQVIFPFFDGLIPEGWLLEIVEETWKFDPKDRMSLLLAFCKDTIGAVSIISMNSEENQKEK